MMIIDPRYEIAAVFFDLVICAFVNLIYTDSSRTTKAFRKLAVYLTIATIIDALTCIAIGMGPQLSVFLHYLLHSLNILSSTMASASYVEYVIACVNVDARKLAFNKINLAIFVVQVFLVLQNVLTGTVFSYTVEGGYVHGMFFYVASAIIPLYYLILASGFIAVNRSSYTILQLVSMAISTVVLVTVYISQIFIFKSASLAFFAASLALLILFFTLETPDFHRLEKTIAKLEKAEKEALEARRRAEEANDVKSEFLSQMSHEIRTPINSILGFNNFILENTRENLTSEYASKIKSAGENLLAFFNNLLSLISQSGDEEVDIKSLFEYTSLIDNDTDEVLVPIMPKASVLVVDDNAMNVDLLLRILKKTEVITDTAADGQKALMKLRKKNYDLIIMDYMMPIMDGVETLSIMREERLCPGAPVVMLTAGGLRGDEERFKELGFDAYLTKPVVANTLYELLADIMPLELIEQRVSLEHLFYKEKKEEYNTAPLPVKKRTLAEIFTDLDTKAGLNYCMEDEEFYISQLEMFIDSGKGDELEGFCKEKDYDNYLISVHALKSTARTIGANALADEALALENAIKEGRTGTVDSDHGQLKLHFDELSEKLRSGLDEYKNGTGAAEPSAEAAIPEIAMSAKSQAEQKNLSLQILLALANTVDAREVSGNGRSMRVAKYATEIARRFGKSDEELKDIYSMALVHDIGKLIIPEKILRKPDSLTEDESEIVRQHPVIGYEILRNVSELPGLATGARWHHERYDGTGYPDGLVGDEIPIEARIIGIADAYDAMTSERPYAPVMPPTRIIKELERNKGVQFDPALVDILIQMIKENL